MDDRTIVYDAFLRPHHVWLFKRAKDAVTNPETVPEHALYAHDESGFLMTYDQLLELVEGMVAGFDVLSAEVIERANGEIAAQFDAAMVEFDGPVEPKPRKKTAKHIYLMDNGIHKKIGVTIDIEARRRALQLASGLPVSVLHTVWCDDALPFEQQLHEAFGYARTHGEWFDLDEEDVRVAIEMMNRGGRS